MFAGIEENEALGINTSWHVVVDQDAAARCAAAPTAIAKSQDTLCIWLATVSGPSALVDSHPLFTRDELRALADYFD